MRGLCKILLSIFYVLLGNRLLIAQSFNVQNNQTAAALANTLVGSGVTVSGASLSCSSLANGIFQNVNPSPASSLAIDSGVILSTGKVLTVTTSSPQDTGIYKDVLITASNNLGITTTDAQITSIVGSGPNQRDLCYLMFNFVPRGDTAIIDYTFASDEYPDYNCTQYNDAFGIFVSPPSSSTYTNYAKVPGTNINVSVNSINDGTKATSSSTYCSSLGTGSPFTSLYVKNVVRNHIVYDGMTTTLRAKIPTTPNQTHSMKVVIADIVDGKYDSGVFLKKSSLTSPILLGITGTKSTDGTSTNPLYLIEGCNPGGVTLTRSSSVSNDTVIATYSGTASSADHNGVASFVIPTGLLTYNYNIQAILDNLAEGMESLKIVFACNSRGFRDSVTFQIKDFGYGISVFNQTNDTTVCNGRTVSLYSSRADTVFKTVWTPASGLSCTNCSNTVYTANNGNIFSTETKYLRISAAGCTDVDSAITINIQPKPSISMPSTFNKCKGDSVVFNPTVSPTSTLYTYTWQANPALSSTTIVNPVAKPSSTQTFKLYVSTSSGCRDSATSVVNIFSINNEIDSIVKTSANCGVSNGAIRIYTRTSTPFNPPYTYSINGGASYVSTSNFTSLAAGSYNVSVKNGSGCRFDTTIVVSSGMTPPTASYTITNTSCGLTNGAVILTSKSGNGPLSFQWKLDTTTVSTDTFLSNRVSGTYSLKVTDVNGCFTIYNAIIIGASTPASILFTRTHPSCGLANGAIVASPTGGNAPFTYSWSPGGATTNVISGLTPGVYKLTLTDTNGCVKIDSSQLFNFPPPVLSMSKTNSSCAVNNGAAMVSISSGGASPYKYSWSNGVSTSFISATTHSISGLSPGKYFVTVLDSRSCVRVDSITITGSPALSISLSKTNASCGNLNGTITTTISGGTASFSFAWSDGSATSQNRTGLGSGYYTVTVTDAVGCTATQSIGVVMTSNPSITLTYVDMTCGVNNGLITTAVTGAVAPITYAWSNSKSTSYIDSLSAGVYTVTMTDGSGCQKIASATIVNQPGVSFNNVTTHPTCGLSNGSISLSNLTGKAPYIINWSDGVTSLNRTGLTAGTYIIFITDSNGCTATQPFTISPSSTPVVSDTIWHAECDSTKGKIALLVNAGKFPYRYAWNSGDTTRVISNKTAAKYTVTVTDSMGCVTIFSDSIIRRPNPTYSDSIRHPRCGPPNGSVTVYNIQGNGPFTYGWTPTNSTSSVNPSLGEGFVYLTVTDAYNCRVKDTFELVTNGALVAAFNETPPACGDSNGSIVATISGGNPPYRFSWSNGDNTYLADTLRHGRYYVTVTDSLGCVLVAAFYLKNVTNLRASLNIQPTRCDSCTGQITPTAVNGNSPFIYIWDGTDTTRVKSKLCTGLYDLRIIDSHKCIYDTVVSVLYTHYPKIIVDSIISETCESSNARIYISIDSTVGKRKIFWDGVSDSVYFKTGLWGPTTKTVSIEDSAKCMASQVITIPEVPLGNAYLTRKLAACSSNNGSLNIIADFTVASATWSNGKTNKDSIAGLAPGVYRVTITDGTPCQYVLVDTIYYSTPPTVTLSITKPNCGRNDGSVRTSVNSLYGGIIHEWKNSAGIKISDSNVLVGIIAGNYSLNITDLHGCSVTTNFTVTDSAGPKANYQITHSNCVNGIGKIKVLPYWGVLPYTFRWTDNTTSDSIINKFAGTYWLTITDSRGCQKIDSIVLKYNRTPQINLFPVNSKCGPNNGIITSTIILGTPPYQFIWSSGDNTQNVSNKSSGKYLLLVIDSVGCKASDSASITSQPALTATLSKRDAYCDLNNGYVNASVTSGTSPFYYNWNGSTSSISISNLDSGMNVFTISDSNNCVFKDSVRVNRIKKQTISNTIIHDNCTYCMGKIFTSVTDGKSPYTYVWSNSSSTNANITNLCAGNVTLSVTDSLGCMVAKTIVIGDTAGPIVSLVKADPSCGNNNGRIDAYVTSSHSPLNHFWNNVSGASSITNLNGGKFVYRVVDNRGCTKLDSIVMDTILPLSLTKNKKNASCGISNGFIKVSASGGTPPYTYNWSHTSPSDTVFNLGVGRYRLSVIDSKGCVLRDSTDITQMGAPVVTISSTPSRCRNNNGSLTATVTNNSSAVNYVWSGGGTNSTIINKGPGSYTVTISDAAGCSVSATHQLISIGVDSITMISSDPKCDINNGFAKGIPVNTKGVYTYKWSHLAATTDSIGSLGQGIYVLTVTDSVCTYVKSATLVMKRKPDIVLTKTNASCGINNGKILSTVSYGTGSINYLWSPTGTTSTSILNLDAGTYTLYVTDAIGCKDTAISTVTRIPMLLVNFSVTKDTCKRRTGKIISTVSGGLGPYYYQWNTGATTANLTNRYAETDTLKLSDNGACTVTSIVTIGEFIKPIVEFDLTPAYCGNSNGAVKAFVKSGTGTSGFSYRWNNGSTADSLNNLASGFYIVTVTDAVGCVASDTATIQAGKVPEPEFDLTQSTCNKPNGQIVASLPRGLNPVFKWSTGYIGDTLKNVPAGTYTVTITDDRNCRFVVTHTITTTSIPILQLSNTNSYCLGANGTVGLNVTQGSPPYNFIWNTGAITQNLTGVPNGTYRVTVTDTKGCADSGKTVVLETPNTLKATAKRNHLKCNNDASGSIEVYATGGNSPYEYKTSIGSYISSYVISGLDAGSYSYTVRDVNGCLFSDTFSLTQPSPIIVDSIKTVDLKCFNVPTGEGDVFISGGTPPYNYLWKPSLRIGKKVSSMYANYYTVEARDAKDCLFLVPVDIKQPAKVEGDSIVVPNSCYGESKATIQIVSFGGTQPHSYKWSTGATTDKIENLKQGKYQVTITDANSCTEVVPCIVSDPPVLSFAQDPIIIPARCREFNEGEIEMNGFGGVAPYLYSIDSGKTFLSKNKYKSLLAGNYHMFIVDAHGCLQYKFDSVGGPPQFKIQAIPKDTTIQLGSSVQLDYAVVAGDPSWAETERWSDHKGLSCVDCKTPIAQPYAPEWYEIQVKYFDGRCIAKDTAYIKIIDNNEIYIPNAFAPSSTYIDPVLNVSNRTFMIYGNNILEAKMKVFNRWGELMFSTKEANRVGWDGMFKGDQAPLDVYSYIVEVTFLSKRKREYKGSVTLVR